jgi:spore maturation protein CgeB
LSGQQPKLSIAYFAHSLRSDWNNGNAHFLRGLMRELVTLGHDVMIYEPDRGWSIENLATEALGKSSLDQFSATYPELNIHTYTSADHTEHWQECLSGTDLVIVHEWNAPELAQMLLLLRADLGFKLMFHDTHHRASSSPGEMERFRLRSFDGVIAFGDSLRQIYSERFGMERVWTLHEAADTKVFKPQPEIHKENTIVWIGNWGDGERSREIRDFLLQPASALRDVAQTTIFGVRYPDEGLTALQQAGVQYRGYLPNLAAPKVYAAARATVHVPRQQYTQAMYGIPTIRIFEALACGIPLVSAPWNDSEALFREGDFSWANNTNEMATALRKLLTDASAAEDQIGRGLETVRTRHTCVHRAKELIAIAEEVIA